MKRLLSKIRLGLAIGFIGLLCGACSDFLASPPDLKYTVWVGNAVVAVGYDTNSYTRESDMVSFTSRKGKKYSVPLTQIYQIAENY